MRGSGAMRVDADERVAVAPFVDQRQGELERGPAVALGHDASAAGKQRLERRGELPPQLRSAPVGGIEEDQIVCVSAGGCAAEGRTGGPWEYDGLRLRQPERGETGADDAGGAGVALDQQGAPSAARERLDAQRAGAREEVEHPRAVDGAERREQRLADAVGRRARPPTRRRLKPPAPEPAGDDPHAPATPRAPAPAAPARPSAPASASRSRASSGAARAGSSASSRAARAWARSSTSASS